MSKKTFHSAGAEHRRHAERAEVISAANSLAERVGVAATRSRPWRKLPVPLNFGQEKESKVKERQHTVRTDTSTKFMERQ